MSLHRRAILACLSIALGAAAYCAHAEEDQPNSLSNIAVTPRPDGGSMIQFDYYFNGEPAGAGLRVDVTRKAGMPTDPTFSIAGAAIKAQPGAHHLAIPISPRESVLARIQVSLEGPLPEKSILVRQEIFAEVGKSADPAAMPDPLQARNEQDLALAVSLIDQACCEEELRRPRELLEKLIARDARFDPAYVELARIAMKSNWGPEGLHQAELLLDSALKIRPDSVNAKILMGYVYAHQTQYAKAEALFVDAARTNPPNLWLWANWGESLAMQGKDDQAIARYREAISRPGESINSGRARLDAYQKLLKLLARRNDADGMEAVYEQHAKNNAQEACITADYARFMLTVRGNARRAIEVARRGLDTPPCGAVSSRQVTGLANYLLWAESQSDDGLAALNQARIYLPAGAQTFYLLATSDQTMPAARKLLGAGEAIDQKDNEGMTALAHALRARDAEASARLLKLGARPDGTVGPENVPVALLPVFAGDLDTVRALRRAGVDYSKISYAGVTAIEFARRSKDPELFQALTGKPNGL